MTAYRFLEPMDVLFPRGNKLFGDPGSFGTALMPPWPSVAAGALRSRMLADAGVDLTAFAEGTQTHPQLGTPDAPGPFMVTAFHLARRQGEEVQTLHPLPADLMVTREEDELRLRPLRPQVLATGTASSAVLPRVPVLASDRQAKPVAGCWVTEAGWARYLSGDLPATDDVVESHQLWSLDHRVGVGLEAERRCAKEGRLFSMEAVVMKRDYGFLVAVDGADPPAGGSLLRLGGDGRAVVLRGVEHRPPKPDLETIATQRRCRLILTSPGIFAGGWRPTGVDAEGRFAMGGVSGRLVCAAVPRAAVVSGWDLAQVRPKAHGQPKAYGRPKDAQRAAPSGSVYWIDELEADPEGLRKLATHGLWSETRYDAVRRAEGFNRFTFATY